jgi:hypothetical protein
LDSPLLKQDYLLAEGYEFADSPEKRAALLAKNALQIPSFATFVQILSDFSDVALSPAELGVELKQRLSVDWANGTAETNAKILLNLARYAELTPPIYTRDRRGHVRPKQSDSQMTLFSSGNNNRRKKA